MRRVAVLVFLIASAAAQGVQLDINGLGSSREQDRYDAAVSLSKCGPAAKMAVPALTKALLDDSSRVTRAARAAIESIGPAGVPALVKALSNPDPDIRADVAWILGSEFPHDIGPYLRTIAGALRDDDATVRQHLAWALGKHGMPAVDILKGLLGRDSRLQDAAVEGLATVGDPAVPALVDVLLSAPGEPARAGAARALGQMKTKLESAADALLLAVGDTSPVVGGAAARALGQTGGIPGKAVPRLLEGLRSANAALREGCIDGLAAYGAPASEGLVAALGVSETRAAAALAILRGAELGTSALASALAGESAPARIAALEVAREIIPSLLPGDVVTAVMACLGHEDPSVRAAAARTVARIGPRPKTDLLTGAAADPEPSVRAAAVAALGEIGIDPGRLDDPDPVVRVEAALAGWRVRGEGADQIGKTAFDGAADPRVRAAAVTALGHMGLAAQAFDLTKLLDGQPVEVRRAAVRALSELTLPSAQAIRDSRAAAKADKAVTEGLAWLAKAQSDEGCWQNGVLTSGTTGLVLLAFLAAGRGTEDPVHGATLKKGLRYLISQQDERGVIGSRSHHEFVVCHGIATIALTEAWILCGDDRCRHAAQHGLDFIVWARNPSLAWRYDPRGGENDTHVTTWMVTALKLGEAAGLRVDDAAYAGVNRWLHLLTAPCGRTGYNWPGGPPARPDGRQDDFPAELVETMTAAGVWCRQLVGGDVLSSPVYRRGIGLLLAREPSTSREARDHIYWNFGALALFQDGSYGKWQKPLLAALSACRDATTGAWRDDDAWSRDGGKVYTTSMAVLTLLTPTRYPRDFLTKPKLSEATRTTIEALKRAQADQDAEVRDLATAALAGLGG